VHWTGWEATAGVVLIFSTLLATRWIRRNRPGLGFSVLFGGTAIFVMLTLTFFIARIESYSQGAAIRFYESLQGKDVYVESYGFKTYGHLFYTKRHPGQSPEGRDRAWLLHGKLDKDLYVVTKIMDADELRAIPGFREIRSQNGFVFFVRRKSG
jgi:hypothetical protein